MLNSIEGVGNLYNISYFINDAVLKTKPNLQNVENMYLRSLDSPVKLSIEACYNAVLRIFEPSTKPEPIIDTHKSETIVPLFTKPQPVEPLRFEKEEEDFKLEEDIISKKIEPRVDLSTLMGNNNLLKNSSITNKPRATPVVTDIDRVKLQQFVGRGEDDEEKINLLEDIRSIKEEIRNLDIPLDNLPEVSEHSNLNDLKALHKILLAKKNKHLNFETINDTLMIGINYLTKYFNGSGNRPNLTGWESTARLKLGLLKPELSKIAADFFRRYNISPIFQVLISLVPSAILHASIGSTQSYRIDNSSAIRDLNQLG